MYEVFFEKRPYVDSSSGSNDLSSLFNVGFKVMQGERPTYPNVDREFTEKEQAYLNTMKKCWEADPDLRPSFTEIYNLLVEANMD
jgi:hypothetical protein